MVINTYKIRLKSDSGFHDIKIEVMNGYSDRAIDIACKIENCPVSAITGLRLVSSKQV